jgi:hypothetical protein
MPYELLTTYCRNASSDYPATRLTAAAHHRMVQGCTMSEIRLGENMTDFTCDYLQASKAFPHFWEHTVGSGHAPLALAGRLASADAALPQ